MKEKSSTLPSNYCPHCHYGVRYEMEYEPAGLRYIYKASCACSYANLAVSETQANDKMFNESYAYELVWQRWKEETDKKSMTKVSGPANEENPDSEETGAIDSDAVWNTVLNAMSRAYTHGWQCSKENQGYDSDTLFRYLDKTLKESLNDLHDNDHPPDH